MSEAASPPARFRPQHARGGLLEDPGARFRLDGRAAVVTGASSGIGQAIACVLHAAGASVIATGRRMDRLEALADEAPGVVPVRCDLTDDAEVEHLVCRVRDYADLAVLVNNAGVATEDPSVAAFSRVLATNVSAAYALTVSLAEQMRDSASVVNVASIFGVVAPGELALPAYSASKGALVQLTRDLAVRYASRGIRVNALAPGYFPTEMTEDFLSTASRVVERATPMGRVGELREIADAALFLACEASSFVTGQVLAVDGGWTAR